MVLVKEFLEIVMDSVSVAGGVRDIVKVSPVFVAVGITDSETVAEIVAVFLEIVAVGAGENVVLSESVIVGMTDFVAVNDCETENVGLVVDVWVAVGGTVSEGVLPVCDTVGVAGSDAVGDVDGVNLEAVGVTVNGSVGVSGIEFEAEGECDSESVAVGGIDWVGVRDPECVVDMVAAEMVFVVGKDSVAVTGEEKLRLFV